jgi:ABC-2 type transport system permease protein
MVAQFLRLTFASLGSGFRRSGWRAFGLAVGLLYTAALTVVVCWVLASARSASDGQLVRDIIVIAGGVVALCFLLVPLVTRHDGTFDPRSYAALGLDPARVSRGLGVASLISVPAFVLAVCAFFTVVTWSGHPGAAVLAFVAALVAVPTWALAARLTASVSAFALASRRMREFGTTIAVLVVVMLLPLGLFLATLNWARDGLRVVHTAADWISWTPFGSVWAVGGDAATGDWGAAVLKLLIALATLLVIAVAWRAIVGHMMVTTDRPVTASTSLSLGWFGRTPARATGAIAARSLTYWGRDSRYWMPLLLVPLFPFVMVGALLVSGAVRPHDVALIPLPVICLFLGWVAHNDVAHDGTAVWLHIVSGTGGLADRLGRLAPVVLLAVPVVAVGSILTVFAYGSWDVLPAITGVSVCLVLCGLGMSSVSSALAPYGAPRPGDSAFAQPQHVGGSAALTQFVTLLLTAVFSAVPITMMVLGAVGDATWFMTCLWTGLGIGAVVFIGGVALGAAAYNRRGPQLMSFALRHA